VSELRARITPAKRPLVAIGSYLSPREMSAMRLEADTGYAPHGVSF